jgi:LCP family protein required for cell wall assembly
MKKTIYIAAGVFAGIILILAGIIFAGNYYYRSVDYKEALTSNNKDITKTSGIAVPSAAADAGNPAASADANTGSPAAPAEIRVPNTPSPDPQKFSDEDRTALTGQQITEESANLVNILFLGLDRTEERDETLGVYRTDSIALASINLDTLDIKVLSIPRDTYVYIPVKKKMDKINHAYVWGGSGEKGIKSSIETVNRFIKYSSVDYYFAIDMEPVPAIVDELGGVELEVDVDMKTHGCNLSKGMQKLNGEQAFQFIRWRYSGGGDIDRVKRQQKLAAAMLSQLKESGSLIESISLVLNYKKYIKTNMDLKQMVALARLWDELPDGKSPEYYIVTGEGKTIDKVWYMIPYEKETDVVLKKVFGIR